MADDFPTNLDFIPHSSAQSPLYFPVFFLLHLNLSVIFVASIEDQERILIISGAFAETDNNAIAKQTPLIIDESLNCFLVYTQLI